MKYHATLIKADTKALTIPLSGSTTVYSTHHHRFSYHVLFSVKYAG